MQCGRCAFARQGRHRKLERTHKLRISRGRRADQVADQHVEWLTLFLRESVGALTGDRDAMTNSLEFSRQARPKIVAVFHDENSAAHRITIAIVQGHCLNPAVERSRPSCLLIRMPARNRCRIYQNKSGVGSLRVWSMTDLPLQTRDSLLFET